MVITVREYIYNEPTFPWVDQSATNWDTKGVLRQGPSYIRRFADGKEGRPQGFTIKLPEGYQNEAHFHTECQFQADLEGLMDFPNHPVEPIGVHYTDANTAYAPFICETDCIVATLRPRHGSGSLHMVHTENRKVRNPYGRELLGGAAGVPWEDLKDIPGGRRKVIFGADGGPSAQLLEYAPGTKVQLAPALYGEWEIVVKGSAVIGDQDLRPYSHRYLVGPDQPSPFVAGPEGVTWLLLTFDEAAQESGAYPDASSPDLNKKRA